MKQVKNVVDHIKLAAAMSGAEIPSNNGLDYRKSDQGAF
jgi:hypothetical protein